MSSNFTREDLLAAFTAGSFQVTNRCLEDMERFHITTADLIRTLEFGFQTTTGGRTQFLGSFYIVACALEKGELVFISAWPAENRPVNQSIIRTWIPNNKDTKRDTGLGNRRHPRRRPRHESNSIDE